MGCIDRGTGYYTDNTVTKWHNCLVKYGWDNGHIRLLIRASYDDVENAMEWLASVDDGDDLDLVMWSSHGGGSSWGYGFKVVDGSSVTDRDLNKWLENCSAKGFCLVACTCQAEWAIDFLKDESRVIMTACSKNKGTWESGYIKNEPFAYFLAEPTNDFWPQDGKPDGALTMKDLDTNHDGWVSAEEAFPYAQEKYVEYKNWVASRQGWDPDDVGDPHIYDGFEGDFTITHVD